MLELKLNKWNNYQAYLCDNFWKKRKVEMRKFLTVSPLE